ncbi:MAG: TetR/AcrR family transcriptional regulator [Phenylobacterium sp.]|uniref:TetR/AcrR family transcriptional regulator n=1 Tax=Phenylobacterium sp. TaxID=1871053 RepID=UPI00391D57A4
MTASRPAARPRRTQAERRDQSERLLLAAAAGLIDERGVGAATFENIGQRAGYSRGLAAQKFGSKQGLIESLIAQLQARLQDQLDARDVDGLPALDAILAFVDVFLRNLAEDGEARAYFILMAGAIGDLSDQRAPFAKAHVEVERKLESLVLRGQAEGAIRPEIDADAAALMIGALLLGLSMQLLIDPKMDLEPIRETSLAALRQSFAAG